jgi:hypothetical protein
MEPPMSRKIFIILWFLLSSAALSGTAFARDGVAAPTPPPAYTPPACNAREVGFSFLLRSDFTDLGPLSCTHDSATAQGATFSWANNLLTGQNSVAADGVAAFDFTCYDPDTGKCGGPGLQGFSIGPYLQGDNTYQFEPTKSQAHNGYTPTPGGFVEVALNSPFGFTGNDDFRFRDGEAFASTNTNSNSFVGEWMPNYNFGNYRNIGFANEIGVTGIYYIPAPELMVQYDRLDAGTSKNLIFSTRNESLRIGPQLSVQFLLDKNKIPDGPLYNFLSGSSVTVTNHESWDDYSGREYSWTQVAITYTAPAPPGDQLRFGATASYGYGNSEATGNKTNQVKVGLAVKY